MGKKKTCSKENILIKGQIDQKKISNLQNQCIHYTN